MEVKDALFLPTENQSLSLFLFLLYVPLQIGKNFPRFGPHTYTNRKQATEYECIFAVKITECSMLMLENDI